MINPVGSSVPILPITIKQGSDLTISMTWRKDDGTPMNLTGYAMRLSLRPLNQSADPFLTLDSAVSTNSHIAIAGAAGTVDLVFVHADTSLLVPKGLVISGANSNARTAFQIGYHDLLFTDPLGKCGYLFQGPTYLQSRETV